MNSFLPIIDWTINVSDVVWALGVLYASLRIGLQIRDSIRDLTAAMASLRLDVDDHEMRLDKHNEWLIQLRTKANLSRRVGDALELEG